jgi:hypothetical protein
MGQGTKMVPLLKPSHLHLTHATPPHPIHAPYTPIDQKNALITPIDKRDHLLTVDAPHIRDAAEKSRRLHAVGEIRGRR